MTMPVTITHAAGSVRIWPHLNPAAMLSDLWRNRALIGLFTRREIEGRYKGSHLGLLWSFITPLAMLGIFTAVFGIVFHARWPSSEGPSSLADFALILFAGQMAFQLFADPVGRSPNIIAGSPNLVKKVAFPLEVLPLTAALTGMYHACIGLCGLLIVSLVFRGSVPWTAALMPLALLPLLLTAVGFTWFFSALGVYIRDLGHFMGVFVQMLIFASAVFYPTSAVPESFRGWMQMNPVAHSVEMIRNCALLGQAPTIRDWAESFLIGIGLAWSGLAWFRATKRGFADVL